MLIESHGISRLNAEQRRRLESPALRRDRHHRHQVRVALAHTLIAWAQRLAPEVPEPNFLRTRAAPN